MFLVPSGGFPFFSGQLRPDSHPVIGTEFLTRNGAACRLLNHGAMLDGKFPLAVTPETNRLNGHAEHGGHSRRAAAFVDSFLDRVHG